MLSLKSIFIYIVLNSILLFISSLHYIIISSIKLNILKCIWYVLKNLIFVKIIDLLVKYIKNKSKYITKNTSNISNTSNTIIYLLSYSIIETITYYIITHNTFFGSFDLLVKYNIYMILKNFIMFIPISFIFDIIFDFFHYWTHRICHANSYLYKNIHKHHHSNVNVTPIVAFVQHPIDIMFTNILPLGLTLVIMKNMNIQFNLFILSCILTYKTYLEVVGHADIKSNRTSSFPQFIWITRILHIQLFNKHHIIHHKRNKNFSKRFSLWDKIFGTFQNK